jgi:hypothetical protein
MELYINSTGLVSAAGSNTAKDFPVAPAAEVIRLSAKEPDYAGVIPPMQLRRMSKAVRISIAASKICLQHAGIDKPDAISVGTAMGCLQDTEQFLSKMIAQDEQMLTPTAFIQSTHNTVSGQIALLCGCHGHNLTYVHRGHSFEHALINTQLYLQQHPGETVLAGGLDELIDASFTLMQRAGIYRTGASVHDGAVAGEGAAFFTVTGQPNAGSILRIKNLHLFVAKDEATANEKLQQFLSGIDSSSTDILLSGDSGDARYAPFYNALHKTFESSSILAFKQLTGEYGTASAAGLSILTDMLKKQSFPASAFINKAPANARQVVMINNYADHYSCWTMEVVG